MFCCGCLNIEAKLRILDENESRAITELLGMKQCQNHNRYLYEYICWTCYVALMKSIKFKEQCLEARNMVLSMVIVTRESLNTFHMSYFKPNLTRSKVVLLNVGPETNEDSFFPIIQEIKSEVPDEGTFTDVNETTCDVKINLPEDNIFSNEYVVKNYREFIGDDQIAPNTVSSVTDKELKEEIVVKEECPDSSEEESIDIADIKPGTPSDDDMPRRKIKEGQVRITLEEIDNGAPARICTLNEIAEKAKQIKLANADLKSFPKNNCNASDVGVSKMLSADSIVDISKSKEIIKPTANCYEANKILRKVNVLSEDKVQAVDVTVQDHKTPKVCYSNADNESFKQCLLNSVDIVTPNTSLDRSDEGNKTNICNEKESENEFMHNTYQNTQVTENILNMNIHKHTGKKLYLCDLCDYKCSRKDYLNTHLKYKHTKEKDFSCHMCPYKCVTKGSLNTHIRFKHTKEKVFSCNICHYECITKSNLIVHLRKHTGEKPYTCDLCDNRFSNTSNLKSHIKYIHTKKNTSSCHVTEDISNKKNCERTEKKLYLCDLCDCKLPNRHNLKKHIMDKHTKEKIFSCHMCRYKCVTKGALKRHIHYHTGEKPYTCDLCDYKCSEKCHLNTHIQFKHTKEKNFSCHVCHYKCVTKYALNRHLRTHSGEKPYKCESCDFKCSDLSQLKAHLISKHEQKTSK